MLNWVAFITYVLVTSITPGPNNIMAMSNATRFGLRKSLNFNLGVCVGFTLIILLCTYLSLALESILPRFRLVMSAVGAAYMLYLAAKLVLSTNGASAGRDEALNSFWAGLGLQFLNPKGIMYALTVAANFLLPYTHSQVMLLVFAVLLGFVGFLTTTCWSLFGVVFQRLLASYLQPFNAAMGLLLVYSAVSLFL